MALPDQDLRIIDDISLELSINSKNVLNTVKLLIEGNTVPFISRYRKEYSGNLTEIDIREIERSFKSLKALNEHKDQVIRLIEEQGKLTSKIRDAINNCKSIAQVEDIYAPFKRRRKTKADIARENGLEPLAKRIFAFDESDPEELGSQFLNEQIKDTFDAFKGAVEIIADRVGHDLEIKEFVKESFSNSEIKVKLPDDIDKEDPKVQIFKDYFEYNESLATLAPHRLLAINRGEKEKILKLRIVIPNKETVIASIKDKFKPEHAQTQKSALEKYFNRGVELAYSKFLAPSNKAELWREKKEFAFQDAINVFSKNLESLLLTPPVSGYTILGIDPGFRTGCKTAIISPKGKVLYTGVLYFTTSGRAEEAIKQFEKLLAEYKVTLISIGDGTASRETEELISNSKIRNKLQIPYLIVTEAGASIYSASEVAGREFPDLDVTLRGTISIARRVQDPLAEYVKIDPWSIGVGQYQHDLPQEELRSALTQTVESVVNRVGVEINNASPQLLSYIAGINSKQANAIYTYVQENGIKSREEVVTIKGIGSKTFQQAAGFLRISNGINPLDATGIHPESYAIATEILEKLDFSVGQLADPQQRYKLKSKLESVNLEKIRKSIQHEVGEFTFTDIIEALKAPFRDPREKLDAPTLRTKAVDIKSLEIGLEVEGVVKNVTNFGAFVDIGLKHSGLVHISELANSFIKDPFEVVQPGDKVKVKVISVDKERNRIGLSMKQISGAISHHRRRQAQKEEGFSQKKSKGKKKFSLHDLQNILDN